MITLPKLSQLDQASSMRVWLATQPADMRCSFDRLAELAASVTGDDPLSGHLFLFRGRGGDRLKILYWDADGYALWYKRLEKGSFRFPTAAAEGATKGVEVKAADLMMILDGVDLGSVRRQRRYSRETVESPR